MITFLLAILQVIIASGILYGYYHFFLRNKKFHQYNRFYLLGAMIISICIPFLQIPVYLSNSGEESSVVLQTLHQISMSGFEDGSDVTLSADPTVQAINWDRILQAIYISISVILMIRIVNSIRLIIRIKRKNRVEKLDGIQFIHTDEPGTPFSFFSWLFWDRKIELRSPAGEQIFRHEIYHIQEKHSWDVLFMELLTMLAWFNPFFYLAKKELKAIHEFLADEFAVNENHKWEYAELLLMKALQTNQNLANPFFHNQIKRRIAMITNPQKTSHKYLRKLLVLPVAAMVLTLFAFKYKQSESISLALAPSEEKAMTIVIDPAHGGIDPGALSPDDRYTEAKLSLELAQRIQALASEYNINVVLTRESDLLPGGAATKDDGLRNRIQIANEVKPDVFIAIHVNSNSVKGYQQKFSGFEAYIAGRKESVTNRVLASAILKEIAPVYKTDPVVKQRNTQGIYVLDHNEFPSILLQCGYINNQKDIDFISKKSNQETVARSILQAMRNYHSGIYKVETGIVTNDTIPPVKENPKTIELLPIAKDSSVRIIGKYSLDAQPLFIVNGVKKIGSSKSVLASVDPNDIESVTVLKDASSIALYGAEGNNGVILITTKKLTKVKGENGNVKEVIVEGHKTIPTEVVVQGYKTEPSVKEVVVEGYKMQPGVKEVVVEGYKTQPIVKEVVVQGYKTQPGVKEVVVDGHKIQPGDLNEVVVVGYGSKLKEVEGPIFEKVEIEPSFPGGASAWTKYLERNLNGNVAVENNAPEGSYTVRIRFIVNTDGRPTNFRPLTHLGYGMEEQVIQVLSKGPNWKPAMQNGKAVNAWKTQPVTFVVDRKPVP